MQCIINMHCIIFLYNSVTSTYVIASTTSTSYVSFDASKLSNYKMVSLSTATKSGLRPLASTVMTIAHFKAFCRSEGTPAICVYAVEPTNYESSAYYTDNKIYMKCTSSWDHAYLHAF